MPQMQSYKFMVHEVGCGGAARELCGNRKKISRGNSTSSLDRAHGEL